MTTARTVPVTTEMDGGELDAEDAWHLACLAVVPFLLAVMGLAADIDDDRPASSPSRWGCCWHSSP